MAAMTRGRTDSNGLVSDITLEYYAQRASAGLLFSEAIRSVKRLPAVRLPQAFLPISK